MNVDDCMSVIENLNEEAHNEVMPLWLNADDQDDEELREEASESQQTIFRDLYKSLLPQEKRVIEHYLKTDPDFKEQFEQYYGLWNR